MNKSQVKEKHGTIFKRAANQCVFSGVCWHKQV